MGKNNNSAVAGMSILCKIHLILLAFIMIPALILVFVYLKNFIRYRRIISRMRWRQLTVPFRMNVIK